MPHPFNEYEKRFLLAEIIKTSSVSLEIFRSIIIEEQIEPKWDEVFVPPGRNVSAAKAAFQELMSTSSGIPQTSTSAGSQIPSSRKRRLSESEATSAVARTLHPKPAANGARVAPFPSPSESGAKKRGRPTKEVLQARKEAAAARGVQYPTLKAAARTSFGAPLNTEMSLVSDGSPSEPAPNVEGGVDSPTSKKRRGRPPKEPLKDTEAETKQVITGPLPALISWANSDQKMQDVAAEAIGVQSTSEKNPNIVQQPAEVFNVVGSVQKAPTPPALPEVEKEVPDSLETGHAQTLEQQPSASL